MIKYCDKITILQHKVYKNVTHYANRNPIGSRLAFQAEGDTKNEHIFATEILNNLDYYKNQTHYSENEKGF